MSSQFYDNALRETYRFAAASLTAAAVVGRVIGPAGKRGRVRNLTAVVTATAGGAGTPTISAGNNGAAAPASLDLPAAAAANSAYQVSNANLKASEDVAADTIVEIAVADPATTTGAADIIVTIDWY